MQKTANEIKRSPTVESGSASRCPEAERFFLTRNALRLEIAGSYLAIFIEGRGKRASTELQSMFLKNASM